MAVPYDTSWVDSIPRDSLIYFAGLFDGEGSIGVYRYGPKKAARLNLSIAVTNTNLEVMQWIAATFKGNVREKTFYGRKRAWSWATAARNAGTILKAIYPFLVIKRDEAALAIEFSNLAAESFASKRPVRRGTPRLSENEIAYRESLAAQIKLLKRREWPEWDGLNTPRKLPTPRPPLPLFRLESPGSSSE